MMKFIAHRGFWSDTHEKNTETAFVRALTAGFGIETDFRDHLGQLVVSHDPPTGEPMKAEDFLKLVASYGQQTLAVNVKADGLQDMLHREFKPLGAENYFLFDMSVPDTLRYLDLKLPVYVRASEYEVPHSMLLARATGVWLDAFISDWYTAETIQTYLDLGIKICIVSPELHKRSHKPSWVRFKEWNFHRNENIHLCTDYPQLALEYFIE